MKKLKTTLFSLILLFIIMVSAKVSELVSNNDNISENIPEDQISDVTQSADDFKIRYIDVGQADASLISCGGKHMLIDGGNRDDSSRIVAILKNENISHLDYIICSHAHEDHVGGLSGALNAVTIGQVFCSVNEYDSATFNNFVKYTKAQGLSVDIPYPGQSLELGNANVLFLGPVDQYEDTNNQSLVVKIFYGDTSFLFTGDMEILSETAMLDENIDVSCDVLKVAHHGSSSSTGYRFLYESMPEYAVISVGKDNSYGHPHDEVLSRLEDAEITVFRTDVNGDIVASSDGKNIVFELQK